MNIENIVCILCKEEKPFDYLYQKVSNLCDGCAEYVANEWYKSHSGKYITWHNTGDELPRLRKKPIPAKLRWAVFKRDEYKCIFCKTEDDLTADHIHPESCGGEATLENLQTLCRTCNSKKSNNIPKSTGSIKTAAGN